MSHDAASLSLREQIEKLPRYDCEPYVTVRLADVLARLPLDNQAPKALVEHLKAYAVEFPDDLGFIVKNLEDVEEGSVEWVAGVIGHLVCSRANLRDRVAELEARLPVEGETGSCIGCGATKLIGYTIDRKPGPFCHECWSALKMHVAQVNLINAAADREELSVETAASQPAETRWQPIATAPKDGTPLLVYDRDCGVLQGYFDSTDGHWYGGIWIQPTHWMPLPSPPSEKGAEP